MMPMQSGQEESKGVLLHDFTKGTSGVSKTK